MRNSLKAIIKIKPRRKIKLLNRPKVSKYVQLKYTNTHRKNEVTTKEKKPQHFISTSKKGNENKNDVLHLLK